MGVILFFCGCVILLVVRILINFSSDGSFVDLHRFCNAGECLLGVEMFWE